MSPFLKLITVLGPPDWKDRYEDCGHRKQSPINIVKSETIKKSFSPLKITFDNARGLVTGTFKNTGHSPELEIADSNGASLTGGPLGGEKLLNCSSFTFTLALLMIADLSTPSMKIDFLVR